MTAVPGRQSSPLVNALSVRCRDILVLQGPPLLGALFAMRADPSATVAPLLPFIPASVLLVAHVFTFNDWAGTPADANDPGRPAAAFLARAVSPGAMLGFSLVLLAAALLMFALLPVQTLWLAIAIAALGIAYSHPVLNAKDAPILSSAVHLIGGILHFLLGYSLCAAVDRQSVLIALFFALTFVAGHLNHEVRDHEVDRLNGVRTNAVRFGKRQAFLAGAAVFTLAYVVLGWLAAAGAIPAWIGWLAPPLYAVHLFWSLRAWRAGLIAGSVRTLRTAYHVLYGVLGLAMASALLLP